MVFVHGYGEYQHMWRFITPEFEDDRRTVLFDIIGEDQGTIDGYPPERYGTLHGHADDLLRILHALDLHQVILVGHSVGGMIGALAAIEEPERIAALIMITASPRYVDADDYTGGFSRTDIEGLLDAIDSNYLGWSRTTAPAVMADGSMPELTEELVQSFARTNPRIALQFARATFLSDHRDDLARLELPVLVLQCTADAMVPPSVGDYLHEHIPGSRLQILNATGHFPHLSAPAPTVEAVRMFVDTVKV